VWYEERALVEILRGRLEGLGPVTQTELAAPLGLEPRALLRLGGRGLRFAGSGLRVSMTNSGATVSFLLAFTLGHLEQ
jgi:hypothetical protein